MTATREHAIQHTIELFFGKRSHGNISYGTLQRRLSELDGKTRIDRNGVAVLIEESPQKLTKLLKVNPPKSPFTAEKTPTTTIAKAIKWHDLLVKKGLSEPRTGCKWADPDASISRSKIKLPINYKIENGNTKLYGIVLSQSEIYELLKNRGLIRWMTVREAVEHPYWEHQADRLLWAQALVEHETRLLDEFAAKIQHSVLQQGGVG